ncbi:MAG TPA: sialidase family protein [Candidatus Acidoferrales bacterium]|nr:sialidase family protein [Candidatus Acidoferrales bacterium]
MSGLAQAWKLTTAPAEVWRSLACSTNATRLIASSDDGTFESLDGGFTWLFLSSTPSASVACSADGTKIIASGPGSVYTSPDSGVTWQQHALTTNDQYYVASSASGTNLVAVGFAGNLGSIYFSTNSGATWALPAGPTNFWLGNIWSSVASSADGTRLVAAAESSDVNSTFLPGPIYTSTNSGATWTLSGAPSNVWYSVACSADGTRLVAAAYAGPSQVGGTGFIYTSADAGVTWTNVSPSTNYWLSVASSASGSNLIAVSLFDQSPENPGVIWRSTNAGANWSEDPFTGYFNSAASSADGTKLAVTAIAQYQIYTLGEPGATAPAVLPALSLTPAGNQLSLTWGVSNAAGFRLFSTPNLAPPATWSLVTNLPTLGTNQIQVQLSPSSPDQFFRLSQQ